MQGPQPPMPPRGLPGLEQRHLGKSISRNRIVELIAFFDNAASILIFIDPLGGRIHRELGVVACFFSDSGLISSSSMTKRSTK